MSSTGELKVHLRRQHPAQRQIVAEAKRFNVVQCGRRFGKTTLGVDLAIDPALEKQPVGWFAPTYKLLDEAWRDARSALRDVVVNVDKQQRRLEIIGGGVIEFWTLDNVDPGRGRKYARVIVDEAGIVRDLEIIWTQAIRPTLTDLKGDAWFFGTPKGRNYFHTLYLRGQQGDPGWMSWRFATVQNPHLDPAEIDDARSELPDLAFRQEYLGEAVEDGSNPFGIAHIRACIQPLCASAFCGPVACWGWDFGRAVDYTVGIGLCKNGHTRQFERFQDPWEVAIPKIVASIRDTPTMVDSTGMGDPIPMVLRKTLPTAQIEGYTFSAQSKQRLMEGLAVAIQQRKVSYPEGRIVEELESFAYEYTRTGVKYSAPPGLHDDCVVALALAVAKLGHTSDVAPYKTARTASYASRRTHA